MTYRIGVDDRDALERAIVEAEQADTIQLPPGGVYDGVDVALRARPGVHVLIVAERSTGWWEAPA